MANELEQQAMAHLLAEAVEVGTLCNLAAEAVLDNGHVATADALSKGALTISRLAVALQQAQQPRNSRIDAGGTPSGESPESWDAVDEALLHWYGHAMTFSQSERQRFFDAIQKFMRHRAQRPDERDERIAELERQNDATYVQQGADAYNHACEAMERFQAGRIAARKDAGCEGSLCDGMSWLYSRIAELEAQQPGAQAVHGWPSDGTYLIHFDDRDQPPEVYAGPGARDAAATRYAEIAPNWNAHLFVKIDSNSRAETSKNAAPLPPLPEGVSEEDVRGIEPYYALVLRQALDALTPFIDMLPDGTALLNTTPTQQQLWKLHAAHSRLSDAAPKAERAARLGVRGENGVQS